MGIVSSLQEISDVAAVIELEGDIDFSISQKLKEELLGVINKGKIKLIVDLEKVRYIDSSGLESITSTQTKAQALHGDLFLVCAEPSIRKIFDITGLDEYIRIFDDLEKARTAIG